MAARKKRIDGKMVTRIGEDHSGFKLLGDCDFNNKKIYGPLYVVDDNGNIVGKLHTDGNLYIKGEVITNATSSELA